MSGQIAVKPYARRFCEPLRTARGSWALRKGFLLRVEREGGYGYGEVAPLPEFGSETVSSAEAFLEALEASPDLAVPDDLPCCAFALSAARLPRPSLRSYSVSGLLSAGAEALGQSAQKLAAGYRSLKWKIGVAPIEEELRIAERLLKSLDGGVRVRFDANGSLSTAQLESWLAVLGQFPGQVDYLEQPLPCGEEAVMQRYLEASGVEIALDESLNGPDGQRWMAPGAWSGPLVIKAPLMGDVVKLAERLEPVARQVVLSSVFETGVGLENSLRIADSLAAVHRPIGFDTMHAFDDALSPLVSEPEICVEARRAYTPEQIWNLI
ncbi:MAG: o-succinylbenzoate synthase [Puniceicoccaceae bacterium]|nr:MAG: o-succinylbenzoate synthase [Puniceicoccaceae bacterium]